MAGFFFYIAIRLFKAAAYPRTVVARWVPAHRCKTPEGRKTISQAVASGGRGKVLADHRIWFDASAKNFLHGVHLKIKTHITIFLTERIILETMFVTLI